MSDVTEPALHRFEVRVNDIGGAPVVPPTHCAMNHHRNIQRSTPTTDIQTRCHASPPALIIGHRFPLHVETILAKPSSHSKGSVEGQARGAFTFLPLTLAHVREPFELTALHHDRRRVRCLLRSQRAIELKLRSAHNRILESAKAPSPS